MEEKKIPIEIDGSVAGGVYSNAAVISHTENEFSLDFIFAQPPRGRVNARVIISPSHAKRLLQALQKNLEMFEQKFGKIKEAPEPPKFNVQFSNN
jgi:hypothetical protein